jgi:hypothetical protein
MPSDSTPWTDAHRDGPSPRYGRPLAQLSYSARFRRLKDPTVHPVVDGLQQKLCAMCCQAKPLDAFRLRRDGVFGRVSHCVPCAPERRREMAAHHGKNYTAYHRQRRFGIDGETFEAMLAAQGGRCAICTSDVPGSARTWVLDHDHGSGRARGVLCQRCNRGLGLLRDDPAVLEAAVRYLRQGRHPRSAALGVAAQGDPSRYRGHRR